MTPETAADREARARDLLARRARMHVVIAETGLDQGAVVRLQDEMLAELLGRRAANDELPLWERRA